MHEGSVKKKIQALIVTDRKKLQKNPSPMSPWQLTRLLEEAIAKLQKFNNRVEERKKAIGDSCRQKKKKKNSARKRIREPLAIHVKAVEK